MTRRLLATGSLVVDDVVAPDGATTLRQLGGAATYAASGAALTGVEAHLWAWAGEEDLTCLEYAVNGLGIVPHLVGRNAPTPRAWQRFSGDGERHEDYQTPWEDVRRLSLTMHDWPAGLEADLGYVFAPVGPGHRTAVDAPTLIGGFRHNGVRRLTWEPPDDLARPDAPAVEATLSACDAVAPNADEWQRVFGEESPEDLAKRGLKAGASIAAIRCGPRGAVVAAGSRLVRLPPAPMGRQVDFTGAGNAFGGAVAAMMTFSDQQPPDLVAIGAAASVAAAMTIESAGPVGITPEIRSEYRTRVDAFVQSVG